MISDILSDAIESVDYYLKEFSGTYHGQLRLDILALRDDMERMRARLDTAPGDEQSSFRAFDGIREVAAGQAPKVVALIHLRDGVILSPETQASIASLAASKGVRYEVFDGLKVGPPLMVMLPAIPGGHGVAQKEFDTEAALLKYLRGL